jgi:hypothetical protein
VGAEFNGIVMSRSRRKTPIIGISTMDTEKDFKRQENRRRRAAERAGKDFVPQSWGPKDGRQWIGGDPDPRLMRK